MEADFSKPVMVTATHLTSLGLGESGSECSDLEYQENAPTIADLISGFREQNLCGPLSFNFCIRLSFETTKDKVSYLYTKSPNVGFTVSCIVPSFADEGAEAPSISINDSDAYTNSADITLTLSALGAKKMYITETKSCTSGGEWEDYNTSKTWRLSQLNTSTSLYVQFEDVLGNKSACLNSSITHDNEPPTGETILINDSDVYTTSSTVTLALSAVLADEMYITNTADCLNGGEWEGYSASKSWTLSQLNTTATIYVQFRDNAGNKSTCISDSIIHDSEGPSASSILANLSTTKTTAAFSWAPSVDEIASTPYEIAIGSSSSSLDDLKSWTSVGHKYGYVVKGLSLTTGTTYYASLRAIDSLGNVGPVITEEFIANSRGSLIGGYYSTCMIITGNNLRCWGYNNYGQLGRGDTTEIGWQAGESISSFADIDLGTGRTAVQVSAGDGHVCSLLDNDTVKCWGRNTEGQLGLGDADHRGDDADEMGDDLPAVDTGSNGLVIDVAALIYGTCFLFDSGKVACFGEGATGFAGVGRTADWGLNANEMGEDLVTVDLGTDRTAVRMTVGERSVCAILDNNTVKCWGLNSYGILGYGHTNHLGDEAGEMGDNLPALELGTDLVIKDITSNRQSHCAIFTNGKMKCWGRNYRGLLGYGHLDNIGNEDGEMGDNLNFVDLGTNKRISRIFTSWFTSCALLTNGETFCWGSNSNGTVGIGSTDNIGDDDNEMGDNLTLLDINHTGSMVQISQGADNHFCALASDGKLKCWGRNDYGQLGNEDSGVFIGDGSNEMGTYLHTSLTGQQ